MMNALTVVLLCLAALFIFGVLPTFIMSWFIFKILLKRDKPEKWDRNCSMPNDEETVVMYNKGLEWGKRWDSVRSDVDIYNDGLHLFGEYFDFGHDKAVIIIGGRMEACYYSYYFAEVYRRARYNVLTIDARAHGKSEGLYNCLGYKEYKDILEWGKLLHDTLGNKKIFLHGICIGSSAALFCLTSKGCPDYMAGMAAEGMYTTFCESTRRHMEFDHRPIFPFMYETMLWIRIVCGANVITDGPIRRIKAMTKPILFLHSREDRFSLPERAQELYDLCPSEKKKLVWFDKGGHSRIRINNEQAYDDEILQFLGEAEL